VHIFWTGRIFHVSAQDCLRHIIGPRCGETFSLLPCGIVEEIAMHLYVADGAGWNDERNQDTAFVHM